MNSIKKLQRNLAQASDYSEWIRLATEIDRLSGALAWREDPASDLFHSALLQEHLAALQQARTSADAHALMSLLIESLYRHLAEIANSRLYQVALSGTKHIISEYLNEVCACIDFLATTDLPAISTAEKLERLQQAYRNFGQTALVLSGGAAFGIYHLGVVKGIWEQGLLPEVISGSSMGAIVAAGICTRNDQELLAFFAHPERIHRQALEVASFAQFRETGFIMRPEKLFEHISTNVGDFTFQEAFAHSGRVLNITVSPTRAHQKPRILSHLSSPEVLIPHAALASCAIPGVFPPVGLKARTPDGRTVPYMATESWIDGSVHSDVPLLRMSRLHNVNHTIVSQANPHVLPFITHTNRQGPLAFLKHAASSIVHAQATEVLELARDALSDSSWRPLLDKAYGMARQTYLGDINVHLPFQPALYKKVASNPSRKDLDQYIALGERAVWPKIQEIADQTCIGAALQRNIQALQGKIDPVPRSASIL